MVVERGHQPLVIPLGWMCVKSSGHQFTVGGGNTLTVDSH